MLAARSGVIAIGALVATLSGLPSAGAQSGAEARPRLDERTAYSIDAGDFKLGLLEAEYGLLDRLAIGVDVPAWAARAFLPIWIANLHTELVLLDAPAFALSLRTGAYYVNLESASDASGSLLAVPTSVFASARLAPRWWLHGEGRYLFARAFGSGDLDDADLNGAVATRSLQLGGVLERQLGQHVSLMAMGRYQVLSGRLVFESRARADEYTTLRVAADLTPRGSQPWQMLGGVAFLWPRVRLVLGAGYGNFFIPGIGVALPNRGFVPDLSLAVVL